MVWCYKVGVWHRAVRGMVTTHTRFILTYVLTLLSRILFEKLTGSQLVKKFPTFYGNRRFITAFTNARHLSLSWACSIQSIPPHLTSPVSYHLFYSCLIIFASLLLLDIYAKFVLVSCSLFFCSPCVFVCFQYHSLFFVSYKIYFFQCSAIFQDIGCECQNGAS